MTVTKLWVVFYLALFPSNENELDWKIYQHSAGFETKEACVKQVETIRKYDNIISAWCDYQGGMY